VNAWKRWQDWVALVLGLLTVIAPFAFGMTGHAALTWVAVVLGVLIALASLWALYQPEQRIPHWVNLILAILLFVSPWVLAFTSFTAMAWSAWILGVLVFLASGWVLVEGRGGQLQHV
jgi:hypothetical protein